MADGDKTRKPRMDEAVALRQNGEYELGLMKYSPNPVLVLNMDSSVRYVNLAFEELTGFTASEVIGKKQPYPWWREETIAEYLQIDKLENYPVRGAERQHRKKNGELFWIERNAAPIFSDGGPKFWLLNWVDITARKRMERELRESEERFRLMTENAQDIIYRVRLVPERAFEYVSPAVTRITGYTPEEHYADPELMLKIVYPEDRPEQAERIKSPQKGPLHSIVRWVHKNSSVIWVEHKNALILDETGNSIAVEGIVRDITERKRTEEEYRTIVSTSIDGFWLADMQGHFLDANAAYSRLSGYSHDELQKMSIPDIEVLEKPEQVAGRIRKIKEVGYDHFETCHRRKDGEIIDVEVSVNYLPAGDGRMFVFIRDITERKKTEGALKASEKKYSDIVEKSNDGILVIQDGLVKFANSNLEHITGYTLGEEIGKPFSGFIAPEYRELVIDRYRQRLAGEEVPNAYEAGILTREGKVISVEINSSIIEYENRPATMAIIRDITERKRAGEALRESEEKYRTLFETMLHGVVYQDVDGRITAANPAAECMLGLTVDQMQGRTSMDPHWRAIHEDGSSFPGETHPSMVALHTGKEVRNVVMGVFNPLDEQYHWISINATPQFRFNESKPYQVYTTFVDITERKIAEQSLRESEEKYHAIFAGARDGISLVDSQTGTIVDCNPEYERQTGRSIAQLRQIKVWEIRPPDKVETTKRVFHEIVAKGIYGPAELEFQKPDGTVLPIEFVAHLVKFGGREYIQSIIRDISDRKRMEEALKASERKYADLVEKSNDMIIIIQDGMVKFTNTKLTQTAGYVHSEEIGKPFSDFVAPEYRQLVLDRYKQRLAGENVPNTYEAGILTKEGKVIPVEINSSIIEFENRPATMAMLRDITERKKAEEAFRKSEERFRRLAENAQDIIFRLRLVPESAFEYVSPAVTRITGYTPEEHYANPKLAYDIVHPDDRAILQERAKSRRDDSAPIEIRWIHKNGTTIWLEERNVLIFDETGKVIALEGIIRDITERKKVEEELRWKTAFLVALVHSSNDGIIVIDQKGARVLQNQRNNEMWKIPREIVERRDDSQVKYIMNMTRHPEQFYERVHYLQTHPYDTTHDEVELLDGTYLERYSSPVTGEDGTYYGRIWTFHDITASKRAEEALRESEENFRSSLDNFPLGVLIRSIDGEILYTNRALLDTYGYKSIEEFRKVPARQRFTPESYAAWEERLTRERRGEQIPPELEVSIIRKDGEIRRLMSFPKEVLWNGKRQHQVIYRDITEQRQVEEALRLSEESFRNSLDTLPLGVRISTGEGEALYMNRALLDIYGYESIEEFRKIPMRQRFTPESYAAWEERLTRERSGEYMPPEIEISIIRKDGEIRRLMAFRKEVLWNGKRQYQVIYRDITEQRRSEELGRKVHEYEELDRLKTAILSTVSHELRTPLAAIKGYATMLLKYDKRLEVGEKQQYLQSIDNATERLTDLVNHLLDMSRLDAGMLRMEKYPTRVSDLLKKAVTEASLTRKDHNIGLTTSNRLPTVSLDPRRIRQVVDNLIDNACKYSPEGTGVIVSAGRKGKELVISVTDHGVGIPESETGKIFNRMHRLEQKLAKDPGGLGLGLSLCKGLVEAHGGRIWVESREGKGSTFYFSLPSDSRAEEIEAVSELNNRQGK